MIQSKYFIICKTNLRKCSLEVSTHFLTDVWLFSLNGPLALQPTAETLVTKMQGCMEGPSGRYHGPSECSTLCFFSLVDLLLLSWILAGIKGASATQRLVRLPSFANFSCYSLVLLYFIILRIVSFSRRGLL